MPLTIESTARFALVDVLWQAKDSYVLVDGCLFEANYANHMGGAIHHDDTHISVVGSAFFNNVAGSENEEDSESCQARTTARDARSVW